MEDSERIERARETLTNCLRAREQIDEFIALAEKEQVARDPEEIAKLFEHLWSCDNSWAFEALTGNTTGAGLCKRKWLELKELMRKNPVNFPWPAIDHMARIEDPNSWRLILGARERQLGRPETPHHKFIYRKLEEWEAKNK